MSQTRTHTTDTHQDEANKASAETDRLTAENERLRALLSWIDGACVDELPHMEIRAAIDRAELHHERCGP